MIVSLQNSTFSTSTIDEIKATMLTELQASMGNITKDLLPELILMLLEDAPPTLTKLRQAIMAGDSPKVRELAHTFKGSCASMGIMTLAAHCEEIENMGRKNQLDTALVKLAHAEAEYEQVKLALSQYV
ncbi:MAG: Hpt domain-containing protein [Chloroflexi bacterium]|nr:Hpt domain-containing protein [Chloroflexota bacterium]